MAAAVNINVNRLKLIAFIETGGGIVLKCILRHSTHVTDTNLTLQEYMNQLDARSTVNYVRLSRMQRRIFSRFELYRVIGDPTWETFELSLLYKAIKYLSENVANLSSPSWSAAHDDLESQISQITSERNSVLHDPDSFWSIDIDNKLIELKNLFLSVLEAARTRYNIPDQVVTIEGEKVENALQHVSRITQEMENVENAAEPVNRYMHIPVPDVHPDHEKMLALVEDHGKTVFRFVLRHITHVTNSSLTLQEYMDQNLTTNRRRMTYIFEENELSQVIGDPSWETFDFITLYKVIRFLYENFAHPNGPAWLAHGDGLEGLLSQIKDERRKLVDDPDAFLKIEFNDAVEEFKSLILGVLEAARMRYNIPHQVITQEREKVENDFEDYYSIL